MRDELTPERRQLGLDLNQAETAIGVGRRAVRELMAVEPIDEEAVAMHRAQVLEARLARNALRQELSKLPEPLTASPGWV